VQEEVLASAHGLYRGGLGVHLGLGSLAGGLGVEVDLDEVAPGSPAYVALYSESAGRFLVSVAPQHRARVEALFRGSPLYLLGQVRPDGIFKVSRGDHLIIDAALPDLQAAWQRRLGGLI
jgi:phosphoribosylformylglycinamidine synthase